MEPLYAGLMSDGWSMREIEEMDILYFLRVRAYTARKRVRKEPGKPAKRYIDEVWPE